MSAKTTYERIQKRMLKAKCPFCRVEFEFPYSDRVDVILFDNWRKYHCCDKAARYKSVRLLRRVLNRINGVWKNYDSLNSWLGVIWLIRKQLEEIEEKKYEATAVLNEMADILIIITRYLDKIGIDPEKLMLQRLETRHRGRVKEITEKYARKFQEEQENALHH